MWGAQVGHATIRFVMLAAPSLIVAGASLLLAAVVLPMLVSYWRASVYAQSVTVTNDAVPSFTERPPYDVAKALADRSLGDTTGDASGIIKALPATSSYSTTIIRRGLFQGNESAQTLHPPLSGSATSKDVTICDFSPSASLRFGGAVPANNLTRAVYWRTSPTTVAREGDAITVCDGDTPRTYVPLVKLRLFPVPHDVPAGVAVYDGSTGDLRIESSLTTDLPLYPKSVATAQRESTMSQGGLLDWIFKRAGWEDTSVDQGDPNGDNRAEFALANSQTTTAFVTPLTPRGSSSSIVALGVIPASGDVKAGQLNPYTVHRLDPPRQANSTVAARITTEKLDSYKATGLTVFEIVPAESGTWRATIGKDQNILYRATIAADGAITLTGGTGGSGSSAGGSGSASAGSLGDVSKMSETEIRDALNRLLDELQRRAAQ
jgi:hypothetical protein